MAKMLGIHASVIRGKLGGNVFTANKYQAIVIRAKTIPVNPNSVGQISSRAAFKAACLKWRNLTILQRSGWDGYALSVDKVGSMGVSRKLSGFNLFVAWVSFATFIVEHSAVPSFSFDSPSSPGAMLDPIVSITGNDEVGETGIKVSINNVNDAESATGDFWVAISPMVSAGRTFYQGPFLHDSAQYASIAAESQLDVVFNGLEDGQSYWVSVRQCSTPPASNQSGKVSNKIFAQGFAVETVA